MIIDAMGDRMNPILYYELRQAANNRILLSLVVFYIALLIFAPIFGANQPWSWTINHQETTALLEVRLTFCFSILILLVFPVARLVDDLVKKDLLFLTDLGPWTILSGKTQSGMVHTGLFYVLGLPFVVAYEWGENLPKTLLVMFLSYLVLILLNAVFLGFMAGARSVVQAIWLGCCVFLYICYGFYTSTGFAKVIAGFADDVFVMPQGFAGIGFDFLDIMPVFLVFHPFVCSWGELPVIALSIVMGFIPAALALLIGNAFLSAPSANRMLPIRIGFSLVGLFLFLCGIALAFTGNSSVPICQWSRLCGAVVAVFLCIAVSERTSWGQRIRRTIPVSFFKRVCVFPFYTGAPNAYAWTLLGLLLSCGFMILSWKDTATRNYICSVISGTMLVFVVCLLASLVRERYFKNRIPQERAWLIPGAVLMSLSVATIFIFLLTGTVFQGGSRSVPHCFIANPLFFAVLDPSLEMIAGMPADRRDIQVIICSQLIFAGIFFALSLVLVFSSMYGNLKEFRRENGFNSPELDSENLIGAGEC